MEDQRRWSSSRVPLQPGPVLGFGGARSQDDAPRRPEQSRGCCLDRSVEAALRNSRNFRAGLDRQDADPRMHPADKLGRARAVATRRAGDSGGARAMNRPFEKGASAFILAAAIAIGAPTGNAPAPLPPSTGFANL